MGQNAIVTGGGRGIGRAIVDRLLADEWSVVTCGRGDRPTDLPSDVTWIRADVSDPAQAQHFVRAAQESRGVISLLVNNAGIQIERTVAESTDDDWTAIINTNCRAVFTLSRAVLPGMMEHGGVIINVGSISGEMSDRSMALYNASKAFVHSLTRSMAVDHGPAVRCNAVSPGWITTAMASDAFSVARDPDAAARDALARHPLGRLGTPRDVANAVAWLASDQASWITGQCLTVDGGLSVVSPVDPRLS